MNRFTITETHSTEQHKMSAHTARDKRNREEPTDFVAIDGEGITLPDGSHRYVLLGIGQDQKKDETGNGLTFGECLKFLYEHRKPGKTAYVGYFLGYDFTQILRTLPEERARMLLSAEGRAKRSRRNSGGNNVPFPVSYKTPEGNWQFDILGMKRFRFRPKPCDGCVGSKGTPTEQCEHVKGIPWMNICDAGPFFQKSFLKTIDPGNWSEPIVSAENYEKILEGKSRRASAVLDDEMCEYNKLENTTLPLVMQRLDMGFRELGIRLNPDQWYGPGQAASAWLSKRMPNLKTELGITGIPEKTILKRAQSTPEIARLLHCDSYDNPSIAWEAARESYFGGWFEIMAHGIVPGDTWEYDINSAYPAVISTLPCMLHGRWIHNGESGQYTLILAEVSGTNPVIGAMPHRTSDGHIYRPHQTYGWFWEHEINAAKAAEIIDTVKIKDKWTYQPCDCPPPLRDVADIYELRRTVGKKTPLGIACKLVPNSLYGKFAQSVGQPEYANPVYASLITAGCRTMILNAIADHPLKAMGVLMIATDGIYFRTRHPNLNIGTDLGAWEENRKRNLCLFKPGVYWDDDARESLAKGEEPAFKSRGINYKNLGKHITAIDAMFNVMREHELIPVMDDDTDANIRDLIKEGRFRWPAVKVPIDFSMTTATLALHRGNWQSAGAVSSTEKLHQSSNPQTKRIEPFWHDGILRTCPREYEDGKTSWGPSTPYNKNFGLEDESNPYSTVSKEAKGITPDGLPADIVREMIIR